MPSLVPPAATAPVAGARPGALVPAPASSIDEVLDALDAVIADAVRARSRVAFFACLYRRVTARVRDGIAAGRFQDGARMARFDVLFANRYLAALAAWRRGDAARTPRCWAEAFAAADDVRPIVLQHLLLGMNAHIAYDLGPAAVETAPGPFLPSLKHDFDAITALLAEMLDDVQARLARVSPWMSWLDTLGGREDEAFGTAAIARARDAAWAAALALAALPPVAHPRALAELDGTVALLARPLRAPGPRLGAALRLVRARETTDVGEVVRALG